MARRIRIEGDLAYVPLTRGYETIVDAEDVHLVDVVEGCWWRALVRPHTVYAVRHSSRDANGRRRLIYMHRALLGDPAGLEVDHRDGNGLLNRRSNLRQATRSENNRNRGILKLNTSGFKGVSWDKLARKWRAAIKANDKTIYLGLHDTAEAAHAAYCEASARLHGEFGRTQ